MRDDAKTSTRIDSHPEAVIDERPVGQLGRGRHRAKRIGADQRVPQERLAKDEEVVDRAAGTAASLAGAYVDPTTRHESTADAIDAPAYRPIGSTTTAVFDERAGHAERVGDALSQDVTERTSLDALKDRAKDAIAIRRVGESLTRRGHQRAAGDEAKGLFSVEVDIEKAAGPTRRMMRDPARVRQELSHRDVAPRRRYRRQQRTHRILEGERTFLDELQGYHGGHRLGDRRETKRRRHRRRRPTATAIDEAAGVPIGGTAMQDADREPARLAKVGADERVVDHAREQGLVRFERRQHRRRRRQCRRSRSQGEGSHDEEDGAPWHHSRFDGRAWSTSTLASSRDVDTAKAEPRSEVT